MGQALASRLSRCETPFSVMAREGPSRRLAEKKGLPLLPWGDTPKSSLFLIALPDRVAASSSLSFLDGVGQEGTIVYLSGWPLLLGSPPPLPDLLLFAPKAIAKRVSEGDYSAAVGVHANRSGNAEDTIPLLSSLLGSTRNIQATATEELVADLFSEQSVLCGWAPELALRAYKTLVDCGIPKELAWEECVGEVAALFDVLATQGPEAFSRMISDAALIGGTRVARDFPETAWDRLVDRILPPIQDLTFPRSLSKGDRDKMRLDALHHWSGRKK